MKHFLIILAALSLTVGCQKSSQNGSSKQDAASTTSAVEEAEETADSSADASADDDQAETADSQEDSENTDNATSAEKVMEVYAGAAFPNRVEHDVTLISAGSEPRKVLIFDLDNIKPVSVEARTEVESNTQGMNLVFPRITQKMSSTKIERNGDTLSVIIKAETPSYEARADDAMHNLLLEGMREAGDAIGDVEFSFDMDAHGTASNSTIISSAGAADEAKNAVETHIEQFGSNLPTEAVGEGATWTSVSRVEVGTDLVLYVTTHNTLTRLTDNGAVIKGKLDVLDMTDSMNQLMADSMGELADEGDELPRVTNASMRGESTVQLELDNLMPRLDQTIVVDITLSVGGMDIPSVVTTRSQFVAVD